MRWRPAALLVGCAGIVLGCVAVRAQDMPGNSPSVVGVPDDGKQIYENICQACHMADAMGGGGAGAAIPALADNPNLADKTFPIQILLKGQGGMPWFSDMLTPVQMAAVLTYIRSHFNTYTEPVTEADVKAVAKGTAVPTPDCDICGE